MKKTFLPPTPKRKDPVERERRWFEPCEKCKKARRIVRNFITGKKHGG